MIRRSLGPLALAFLLFFLAVFSIGPSRYLLEKIYFKPGVVQTVGAAQATTTFQGLILQEKALDLPDILPVYGSSEFSAKSEFHPSSVFDGKPSGFVPFLVGQGGSQSLVHSINLGALGDDLKGKKVAIIISSQWFTPAGIDKNSLAQNFSPLQTYHILANDSLSPELKQKLVTRLLQFPEVFERYPILYKNLQYYGTNDWTKLPQKEIYQVMGWFGMKGLEVRDTIKTTQLVSVYKEDDVKQNAGSGEQRSLDWVELREKANQKGAGLSTNNTIGIMDSYYTTYVEPNLEKYKGAKADERLYPSPEYDDLELLMEILKEKGAKALFVMVPVNGPWYDYTGFPLQERQDCYRRVAKMVQENGFELADFSGHEYDKYFLQDIMHLGWKGWVYVDEALDKFYHQGD